MENLYIQGTSNIYFQPTVDFNAETGVCELRGESYLEETVKFYYPIINWLKEYAAADKGAIVFNFMLTYFNTNSARSILDILDVLKEFEEAGGKVSVNWYCDEEDVEDVEEEVEDYMIESDLEINLKIYDK